MKLCIPIAGHIGHSLIKMAGIIHSGKFSLDFIGNGVADPSAVEGEVVSTHGSGCITSQPHSSYTFS